MQLNNYFLNSHKEKIKIKILQRKHKNKKSYKEYKNNPCRRNFSNGFYSCLWNS